MCLAPGARPPPPLEVAIDRSAPPQACQYRSWATQELKDALSERGLDTTGLKPVLVDRLESALRAEQPNGEAAPNGTAEPAEEPIEDVTAPDTAAAEADDAAPASAVSTVRAVPGEVAKDASSLVISE